MNSNIHGKHEKAISRECIVQLKIFHRREKKKKQQ